MTCSESVSPGIKVGADIQGSETGQIACLQDLHLMFRDVYGTILPCGFQW